MLWIAIMFHAECFEPHICITEGFGALEMHSLFIMFTGKHGCKSLTSVNQP